MKQETKKVKILPGSATCATISNKKTQYTNMTKKSLTEREKIDKFLHWLKEEKNNAKLECSYLTENEAYYDGITVTYNWCCHFELQILKALTNQV